VLAKLSVGNFSTSKKSADRRCVSRSFSLVSTLADWIVTDTDEALALLSSNSIVPSKSSKRPRTLVTRWRTWNRTSEWDLSILYVATGDLLRSCRGRRARAPALSSNPQQTDDRR
jgi:hypothetical protein